MAVRAKFKVDSILRTTGSRPVQGPEGKTIYEACDFWTVNMSPVYGKGDPEHENTKFWQATPTGQISLGTVNPAAVAGFDLRREYYVDFTEAPE